MLEGDDQWRPASHLRPDTTNELTGYSLALDSLGRGESEDVDQHDLPPDPQSGPDNVSDDVGQRLHHLPVLGKIIARVLISLRVELTYLDRQTVDQDVVSPVSRHLLHLSIHLEHLPGYQTFIFGLPPLIISLSLWSL